MGIRKYGLSSDEKTHEESLEAREIVKNIIDYGVSQKQIMYIINDLALNIENIEHSKRIIQLLQDLSDNDVSDIMGWRGNTWVDQ